MSAYFKGIKRTAVEMRQRAPDGGARETGKDSLPFELYRLLAMEMLTSTDEGQIWAHAYGVFTWNLMCRTNNTAALRIWQVRMGGDALMVSFFKTKTDQGGDNVREPAYVYANPEMPEICPVLALALSLLYFGCGPNGELFAGTKQSERFSEGFGRALRKLDAGGRLRAHGRTRENLGVHSYRKGSTTYTTSGSTAGPSFAAVCQRAKWKLGTVQDSYLRYERASDQYVGRVVAGLPLDRPEFALLPPHFPSHCPQVDDAVMDTFSADLTRREECIPVLRLCIASLVWHADWLRGMLPPSSRLLSLPFLADRGHLNRLKRFVVTGFRSDSMHASGIPEHVVQMTRFRGVQDDMQETKAAVSRLTERVVLMPREIASEVSDAVSAELELRAVDSGNVTPAVMHGIVMREVGELMDRRLGGLRDLQDEMRQLVGSLQGGREADGTADGPGRSEDVVEFRRHSGGWKLYSWAGGLHFLPEDFVLPRINVQTAWSLWWLGPPVREDADALPPLRVLTPTRDLPPSQVRRFQVWATLFRRFELILKHREALVENPNPAPREVLGMFESLRDVLYARCAGQKRARATQLMVDTVERRFRLKEDELVALATDATLQNTCD